MSFLKNKFVIIIILAILAGGITGLYLSNMKKSTDTITPTATSTSGSGTNTEKVGEIMQKLNDITNE